jgi:hypothetical protein
VDEGKTESGKTKAGLDMLGRTSVVQENGKQAFYLFAALNQGKEMFAVKVHYSSPAVFKQYQADVEMILQTAKLPGAKTEGPRPAVGTKHRVYDVEVTVPEGWGFVAEAAGLASIHNIELKEANDPNEFVGLLVRAETGRWGNEPLFEDAFRADTDRLLPPRRVEEGSDSGYQKGRSGSGLETLTRRARYKYTTRQTYHWDHIGLWKGKSAATVSIRYSDEAIYKKHQRDVELIINNLRFWQ